MNFAALLCCRAIKKELTLSFWNVSFFFLFKKIIFAKV